MPQQHPMAGICPEKAALPTMDATKMPTYIGQSVPEAAKTLIGLPSISVYLKMPLPAGAAAPADSSHASTHWA